MRDLVVLPGRVVLFGVLLATGHAATTPGADPTKPGGAALVRMPLETGATREEVLAGGGPQTYRFDLPAGVFAQIEVMQRGVDVYLVPREADGRQQPFIDSPNGKKGPERAYLLGNGKGPMYLEVRNGDPGGPPGRYTLRVEAVHPAGPADRSLVQAERDFAQAEGERRERTAISLKQAEAGFLVARERFEALGNPLRVAEVFDRLGRVRLDLGVAEESKVAYREAYRRFWELIQGNASPALQGEAASTLDGLGIAYWMLGDSGRAIVSHEKALAIYRGQGDRPSQAGSLNNLGTDLDLRGETARAVEAYDEAIDIWRPAGDRRVGIAFANRGRLYLTRGDLELAKADLLAARPYFETTQGAARELAALLLELAEAGLDKGEDIQKPVAQALGLTRRFADPRGEAVALNLLGRIAVKHGEFNRAIGFHRRALQIFQGLGANREIAVTNALTGQAELRARRCRAAMDLFAQARAQFSAIDDRPGETSAFLGQARSYHCLGDLPKAERAVEKVLVGIEQLSLDIEGPGLRASLKSRWHESFELAVNLAMLRHAQEPAGGHDRRALALSERARAGRLIESLRDATLEGDACENEISGTQEPRLDQLLNSASHRSIYLAATGAPEAVRSRSALEFERLLEKRERIVDRCRRNKFRQLVPEWRRLAAGLGTAGFDRFLEPGTALIEYSLGSERSFAWWVDEGTIRTAELLSRDRIEPIARRLRGLIGAGRPKTSRESIARDLAALSRLLIEPLPRRNGIRKLLIVPDGDLFLVPFAALPLPGGDDVLVDKFEVAMIPSVAALLAIRSRPRPKPELTLGILVGPTSSPAWPPLPWAFHEASAIRSLVPRSERIVASGGAANRSNFLRWPFRRTRLLHFATHTWFDGDHPSLSGLLLAEENGRDEWLRAYEIQRFHLSADLVVLSACETGRKVGNEVRGEGLLGLAQSFLVAGAGSVMASLWQVHDEPTGRLMESFYTGLLRDGLRPSAALRRAELDLRSHADWRDPYYWAGFVLFGNPRADVHL